MNVSLMTGLTAAFAKAGFWALVGAFLLAVIARLMTYFKVRGPHRLLSALEKKAHAQLANPKREGGSFPWLVQSFFDEGIREYFQSQSKLYALERRLLKTEKIAHDMAAAIRQSAASWRHTEVLPRFVEFARFTLGTHPQVTRLLGIFPLGGCHRFLNAVPSLLLLGGSAWTVLGVMSVMPELELVSIADTAGVKRAVDGALSQLVVYLGFSAASMALAALLVAVNAAFDPERTFHSAVLRLGAVLELLWQDTAPAVQKTSQASPLWEGQTTADPKVAPTAVPQPTGEAPSERKHESVPDGAFSPLPAPIGEEPGEDTVTAEVKLGESHSEDNPTASAPSASKTKAAKPDWSIPESPTESELVSMTLSQDWEKLGQSDIEISAPPGPGDGLWAVSRPSSDSEQEDRLAVLRHRLGVIEQYLAKADEDKAHGLIDEEMWKEETERWSGERVKIQEEIGALERHAPKAA